VQVFVEGTLETAMQITRAKQKDGTQHLNQREYERSGFAGLVMKRFCSVAALLAVMVGLPVSSRADIPLVYNVEFTGTNFPAPPLPVLPNIPIILPLPDPFAWANDPLNMAGTRSTNFTDWSHHRAEFKAQLENYEIGTKPAVDPTNIFASYSATTATNGTLTVRVTNVVAGVTRTLTLTSPITFPPGAGPFPAIIGMNSPNGSISLGGRAIATITYFHDQVTTYNAPANSNPYYLLYAAPYSPALSVTNTGQYSAWAWGVSRIIDGLFKLNGMLGTNQINLQRIGVTGCSYAGKMALFAGAFDERVALTIPQESGGGGAPNWRYSYQDEPYGSVEGLAQTSHQWFSPGMFAFADANTAKLPEDHHELMAMVAPRALFATGNPDGAVWLSNPSCYVSCKAVEQIYNTFGVSDRFGYNINGGKPHCALTADVNSDVWAFLDKFLMGTNTLNTVTNRHVPSTYSTIDYARWYNWWGSTNPIFPYTGKLTLAAPAAATEGDGVLAGMGMASVTPTPSNADVVVNLTSSNTNKITVPASIVIPAGQSNAAFDLTVIDNLILDGDKSAVITATSPECNNGPQTKTVVVHDNETTTLAVTLPASALESAGTLIGAGTVTMGAPAGASVTVSLSRTNTTRLLLPATITIPTGQTSAVFNLTFVNDNVFEGSETAVVTAHVANWTDGVASMTILDDDLPDHFAWSTVPSPQLIGEPFPVTITAQDPAGNTVNYQSTVALSALFPGSAAGTNSMLGSPGLDQTLFDGNEYTLGYSFTPNTYLKVTAVRAYFGDKVSIWTDSGQLLVSQNVASVPGTWVDTPLPSLLLLAPGVTYRIVVHENAVDFYWGLSLPTTFADGTINQSIWDYGDVFPTRVDSRQWDFVDLLYATDVVSTPINPGATANFSSGVWSGNVGVPQAGTNVMLEAIAGVGHSGTSAPFDVLGTPKLAITSSGNSVVLSWPAAATGFTLEQASTLPNWADAPGTTYTVGDRFNVTNTIGTDPVYFRLRKP
jgi:hypothetical protein